jgi:CRISPR-associated protein Cmr2
MSEFLNKKIIAYFHDPPWKAWILSRKPVLVQSGGHVADAIELIKRLGVNINSLPEEIEMADRLASSIDRWVISDTGEQKSGKSSVVPLTSKLNMFTPWKRFEINGEVTDNKIVTYVDELVKAVNNEVLKYHLLYFLSPLLWYELFPNCPPIADTRVPTHTIFDHATATSAMTNIIECKNGYLEFKGSMAVLEFPSIQEFISFSRKTRDLWASSWLSSALLWKAIESFVRDYGPDVVLRPELSLNHFFISWLYNNVNNKEIVKKYAEKFADLSTAPKISMMSEKVILILPESRDSVKNKLIEGFYKGWKTISEEALKNWKNIDYIIRAIEEPPIKPIVNVIDVKEVFEEYMKKISEKGSLDKLVCGKIVPIEYSLLFEYLYKKVLEYPKIKYSYGSLISDVIYEVTQNEYQVCTVCGILPSVLYYHENDTIDSNYNNDIDDRLCPYCAVKRALKGETLNDVLKSLSLLISPERFRYPSTSELAMQNYAYHYINKYKKLPEVQEIIFGDEIDKVFINPIAAENYCRCYAGIESACTIVDKELLKKYGNLYYAIIKADGDFMGSGYWSCRLVDEKGTPIKVDRYLDIIVNALSSYLNKNDLKQINNKTLEIKKRIIELRKKLYGEEDDRIPLTLSYAYTLSRSLTIQAILDKRLLKEFGAVPVYLGGDDILAFSPIKYKDEWMVIKAIVKTREAYWQYPKFDGFKSNEGFVVDALRAYGRSYSVFVAHYKDPLPLSLSVANYLLDLKDGVEEKDVLFISSGRGIGNLNYALLKLSGSANLNLTQLSLLERILKLIELKKISNSIIYDILSLIEYKNEGTIFRNLIYRAIERNIISNRENIAEELKELIKDLVSKEVCKGEVCRDREIFTNIVYAAYYLR